MVSRLETQHPALMVPHVHSFSVVIYNNGSMSSLGALQKAVREAIIAALPPGTGVGEVSCVGHGVYSGPQGASS